MLAIIILSTIVIDQATKFLAGSFGMVTLNPGISFGWLSVFPSWALTLALMVLLLAVWWMTRSDWSTHPIAMGLFIGGAISNLLDRVIWSGVRDWLPVPLTAIHNNLADYAIAIGLLLLIARHWQTYWKSHHAD